MLFRHTLAAAAVWFFSTVVWMSSTDTPLDGSLNWLVPLVLSGTLLMVIVGSISALNPRSARLHWSATTIQAGGAILFVMGVGVLVWARMDLYGPTVASTMVALGAMGWWTYEASPIGRWSHVSREYTDMCLDES